MKNETVTTDQIFHPLEHAILCDWLQRERPPGISGIDIEAQLDGPDDGPVTLKSALYGDTNEFTLANAVARLVLGAIQQRLPTTAICYTDQIVLTRDYNPKGKRKLDLLPRFLFQINWADSGPGISWPVAYYVTWLPLYDVYIITESADSPDTFGYCDRALGWFDPDTPLEEGAQRVIAGDWQYQHDAWDQQHWEHFWEEGLISSADAWAWAAEIWEDEEDEDWEEEEDDERDEEADEVCR